MLHKITLHLARNPLYPDVSNRHGYEIVAPLLKEGISTDPLGSASSKSAGYSLLGGLP